MRKRYLALLILLGCGPAAVQSPTPQTPPQPELAQQLVDSTALRRPLHLVFSWNFTEENARFSGQGATRVEPPYRARLDLFGPRGETYLAAAAECGREGVMPVQGHAYSPEALDATTS